MSVESSQETQVEAAVYGMWAALSVRDWQAVKSYLSQDCLYLDMPVGPAAAARGPVGGPKAGPGVARRQAGYVPGSEAVAPGPGSW